MYCKKVASLRYGCGISYLMNDLWVCTSDNPRGKARELSSPTDTHTQNIH